jgi:RHS repeat-associated protein
MTTNYTLDLNSGLTQVLNDGNYDYLYGVGRIAQKVTPYLTEYYLTDALGSVRQVASSAGEVTLSKRYDPYGWVLDFEGGSNPSFGFTGEMQDSTGMVYLRARYYAPTDGRFLSRDTWEGDANNPMSYNAWLYTYANPILYTDPSGFDPLDMTWQSKFKNKFKRSPVDFDVIARLFELAYPDEYRWDDFYFANTRNNYSAANIRLTNPPVTRSWRSLGDALTRLAKWYTIGEKYIFVRDIATLYAGSPNRLGDGMKMDTLTVMRNSLGATWTYLHPDGIDPKLLGYDTDGNVHHWVAFFGLGYSYGPLLGEPINFARECREYNPNHANAPENFQADVELGARASRMGAAFNVDEYQRENSTIRYYNLYATWRELNFTP